TNVSSGVHARKTAPCVMPFFDGSFISVLPDQPRHLRAAQACHLCEIASQQAFVCFLKELVLLVHQGRANPAVNLLPTPPCKTNLLTALQEGPDLLQAHGPFFHHADDQSPACPLPPSSGSSCIRNTLRLQAHLVLDKTCRHKSRLPVPLFRKKHAL